MSARQSSPAIERSAPVFAALGDRKRLHVISRLSREGPLSITALTEGAEVTRQAMTKHLNVLAGAGLVRDFHKGREHVWQLRTEQIDKANRALEAISKRWDEALDRLRAMVEDPM